MEKNKDWTEHIARKLRTGSDKAPDRIWDAIQRDMAAKPKPRRGRIIRRWIAYTSGIAALVALVLTITTSLHKKTYITPEISETKHIIAAERNIIPHRIAEESVKIHNYRNKKEAADDNIITAPLTCNDEATVIDTVSNGTDKNNIVNDTAGEVGKKQETKTESNSIEQPYNFEEAAGRYHKVSKSNSRWSVGLSGSALAMTSNNNSANKMFNIPSHNLEPTEGDLTERPGNSYYKYEHFQPISIGLSATFGIGHGLQIGTGINYTLLHSRAIAAMDNRNIDQKLHMIGIPVSLTWSFINWGKFSSYVGVEAMGEKCVYAKFGDKKVDEKELQFSMGAVVGAQYRILPNFAVYVEPKLTHYFTDTELRTIRTDKNVIFNLQLGFRLAY